MIETVMTSENQNQDKPSRHASWLRSFIKNGVFAVLLLVLGGVAGYRLREMNGLPFLGQSSGASLIQVQNTTQPADFKSISFQQFWDVWRILQQNYVDQTKLQNDQMVYGAIKGMVAALGDPYTLYLPPSDQKRAAEDLNGSFYGVGIQLDFVDSTMAAMSVLPNTPAARAGVQAKDLILHIKDAAKGFDKDTTNMSLADAVSAIRGDKGTSVTLTLYRKDDKTKEPYEVTLQRDEIIVPSAVVAYQTVNGKKIAVITLSKFGERTDTEMATVVQDIQKQSPKVNGIVLDMRNNPGGLLDTAVDVASLFIKNGLVVTQQGRFDSKPYNVNGNSPLADYPIVVTVNGGSASAAEILAGALRDRRSAELVGEKTFGKGSVQDALQLDIGAGLHVTVAKWLLPKGDWINQTGIPVAVTVKDDPNTPQDEVIQKAVEELGKNI